MTIVGKQTDKEIFTFSPNLTKEQHIKILAEMSNFEFARFRYFQEMAGAYLAAGKFEDVLINAMNMCDRISLKNKLGADAMKWEKYLAKRKILQGSTLGNLIKILENHSLAAGDIKYSKGIKDKRDYFVHRLFHEGAWLGDLDEEDCLFMTRRLLAIQLWLSRAERNIWSIFERAGFVELQRLEDGGILSMNIGLLSYAEDEDED